MMSEADLLQRVVRSHSPFISADELEQVLEDPTLKLFDVRGTWSTPARALPDDFKSGHIPSAKFLDWTKHFLQQDVAPGLAAVSNKAGAAKAFRELGVDQGDLVVLYDDYSHMLAGRIWWAMRYWGFENVKVLNGGLKFWQSQGKAISTADVSPTVGSFVPVLNASYLCDLQTVADREPSTCLVDARGIDGFRGDLEDPRTGHIPGALHVGFKDVLEEATGLFLKDEELIKVFNEKLPNWQTGNVISSCGSGYAGTVLLLALKQLGVDAPLFDGSIAEWKLDPERPLEQVSL